MITRTVSAVQIESWQEQLARAITDPEFLLERLGLSASLLPKARAAARLFPLRVPEAYLARMRPGDPDDPLLLQVLPLGLELLDVPGFSLDPLAETDHNPVPGVVHKYHGRLLLIAAGACAINCRFCFRRHFPYADNRLSRSQIEAAVDYIARDSSLHEVILSGGDPLANSDARLDELISALEAIPHLKRLRIHTRLPVVLPDRITPALAERLGRSRLQSVMVIHCNHPAELDTSVARALDQLRQQEVTLLNQSVLLAGINDDAEILYALSERLFEHGVLPYYLHLLDRVAGAAHFEVSQEHAEQLLANLTLRAPGYLVPKLARETPGIRAKQTFAARL